MTILDRRRFVRTALVGSAAGCLPNFLLGREASQEPARSALPRMGAVPGPAGSDVTDQALEILAPTGPEYGGGLSNHGPMAAEALLTLGRSEAVLPWVEEYRRRLQSHPEARRPIDPAEWRAALGEAGRVGDWIAFFDRQVREREWRAVLGEWTPRLAPGLAAAATHGLIRTGHAARSLARQDTAPRRGELAEGLGYWAARFIALPAAADAGSGRLKPSQAIHGVEPLPDEKRASGSIAEALRRVGGFPPFAGVIDLVDVSGDASRVLSDLTETFAGVYLANVRPGNLIGLIHAVTGSSAIRLLLPHLAPEAGRSLLRYGWQAAAAIYAAFGGRPGPASIGAPGEERTIARDELIDRAVATRDEHAIKFTEACLREQALNPAPIYLKAARDAVLRL